MKYVSDKNVKTVVHIQNRAEILKNERMNVEKDKIKHMFCPI